MPKISKPLKTNPPQAQIQVFETHAALGRAAARDIADCAAEAIAARGRFTIAISGGKLPEQVLPPLIELVPPNQWAHWAVFWVDERMVPHTHADSNFKLVREAFLDHVPIPPENIFPVDTALPTAQAAQNYQKLVETEVGNPPEFDLILLGIGPDGHTASLFPGHPLLDEKKAVVAPIFDSPKPPPERVTLTMPQLNRARHIFFIVTGEHKADTLSRIFSPGANPLPSARVHPPDNPVQWYLDTAVAKNLAPKN